MSNSPNEEVKRLIETLRAPVSQPKQQPVRVDNARGCVIILGGQPSVIVKQGGKQE